MILIVLLLSQFVFSASAAKSDPIVVEPMTQSRTSGFAPGYTISGNGAADMVSIALAQEGRTGSQFGYTEEWCADFVSDCAIIAGQRDAVPQYGGVEGLKNRIITAGGWVTTTSPKPGDICFIDWDKNGGYGHVEIVYAVSGTTVSTIGGNSGSGSTKYSRSVYKHPSLNSGYITCIVRPKYAGTSAPVTKPTVASLSTNYTSYKVDETVVFTIVADGNVNNLWIYCPNGDTLTYTDVGYRYELAFGMSGHFQALVETWNAYGSKCSDRIDFYVGNPTYARVTTNKTYYAVDERVYFTIEADGIKNVLWIYCPNGDTLTYDDVGSSYDLGFGMSGHFQALVQTWNGVGSKISDRIDFYVGNQTVTVTFNPNGGSVSPTSKTATIGSTYGTLPTPARTNYTFDGWYTAASSGSKVTSSTTVTATSNHTLYAHWTHVCASGHNYSYTVDKPPTTASTGSLKGTCSRCGATTSVTLPKLNTTDYNYSVSKAATCTATGAGTYTWKTTTYGTFFFIVTIPKTPHNYQNTVTNPSCTEQGYTTHTCSYCSTSYVDSYVEPLGHEWGEWIETAAPSCTDKGIEARACTRCDEFETRDIAALGHDLIHHDAQAPTCTENGWKAYDTCSRCDYTTYEELHALDHQYSLTGWTWTGYTSAKATFTCKNDSSHTQVVTATITNDRTEPTCTASGKVVYTAKVSFEGKDYTDTKTEILAALGHDWNDPTYTWNSDNSEVTASHACKRDASHVETEVVNTTSAVATAPTCEAKGKTTYTATFTNPTFAKQTKTVTNIPATGHTLAVAVHENEKAPTCTAAGSYDEVVYCSVCNKELSRETKTVAALDHAWGSWTQTVAPNCTDKGVETRTCSRCSTTETRDIAALAHDLIAHEAKAPNCTEIGWSAYDTCSRCDYTTYAEIPATGHTPGEAIIENEVAATCTGTGSYDEVVYCTVCGAELTRETKTVAALGHAWDGGVVTVEPKEGVEGVRTFTCTVCGATKTGTIPPLDHVHSGQLVAATAPTCTEAGNTAYYTCKCGLWFADEPCTAEIKDHDSVIIPATGHTPGEAIIENEVAATCTGTGSYDEVVYCSTCGAEISRETKTTEALGHTWDDGVVTIIPTEDAEGEMTYTCTRCGAARTEVIPKPDHEHTYEDVVTAPTCMEQGFTTHTCSKCGLSYVDTYVDALGHAWDDGVVTTEPTFDTEGVKTFTCTRCGETKTEATVTEILSAQRDAAVVTAEIACMQDSGARVICAFYDADGRLLHTVIQPLQSGKNSLSFTISDANAACAKLFVLDAKNAPAAAGKTVQLNS